MYAEVETDQSRVDWQHDPKRHQPQVLAPFQQQEIVFQTCWRAFSALGEQAKEDGIDGWGQGSIGVASDAHLAVDTEVGGIDDMASRLTVHFSGGKGGSICGGDAGGVYGDCQAQKW